jgi:acyl-CoA reductase-like NAD-dependent aldehyde dehydrogenase
MGNMMQTHWINNVAMPGSGEIPVVNPATEEVIDVVPKGSAGEADAAVIAAADAFPPWAALTPNARRDAMRTAADKLAIMRDELARLFTMEMGKPLAQARGEIGAAIDTMRSFAELATHLRSGSQMAPHGEISFQQRVPRGVAACIIPWNFPIAVGLENVVPNLLVGNTVVWKPSEKTPLASRLIAERAFDHLPPGVLNVLLGDGPGAGDPLVRHPQVELVVFVGSERTGRRLAEICGRELKKAVIELGGKDPLIVDETVDVRAAARLGAEAAYFNAGQICTSTERLYVSKRIFDDYVEALVEESRKIRLGDGLEPDVQMGPLVDRLQLDRVAAHVDDAVTEGANVLCGGHRLERKGFFYPPTVVTGISAGSRLMVEETFGPVAPCVPFDDFDEAIALANSSPYGLAAIVCTASGARAIKAVHELNAGMVKINAMRGKAPGATSEPFGTSGLGHGYGVEFLYELTRQKSVQWRAAPK